MTNDGCLGIARIFTKSYKILLQDRFDTAKRLTTTIFSSCKSARSREMERVRRGTSELRPRNVKASRRPGRKSFLVIHPSTGTGQAKNVNYGSAVQPERPHAPPFPFHAESCKIWHRPSFFLFSFFFFQPLQPLSSCFFKWDKFSKYWSILRIAFSSIFINRGDNNNGVNLWCLKKYWILDK